MQLNYLIHSCLVRTASPHSTVVPGGGLVVVDPVSTGNTNMVSGCCSINYVAGLSSRLCSLISNIERPTYLSVAPLKIV